MQRLHQKRSDKLDVKNKFGVQVDANTTPLKRVREARTAGGASGQFAAGSCCQVGQIRDGQGTSREAQVPTSGAALEGRRA